MTNTQKKIARVVGNILTLISIVAIMIKLFRTAGNTFSTLKWESCFFYMLISLLIYTISFSSVSFAWKLLLEYLTNKKINFKDSYYFYNKANLGKYLPGNVMQYVERNVFMAQKGAGQLEVFTCSVLEIIGIMLSAILLSFCLSWKSICSFVQKQLAEHVFYILVAGIILVVVVCSLFILCKHSKSIKNILKFILNKRFIPVFLVCIGIYLLLLVVHGLTLLICLHIFPVNLGFTDVRTLLSANALSWLAGFVVIGAPGGIGIREVVLSALTADLSYSNYILIAALIHRFVLVAADFLSHLVGVVAMHIKLSLIGCDEK